MKPKLIIDTDAGHDDALAILLLICSDMFDLQALTTVAGNSTITNVTRNAQAVLDLVGSKLPVYSGSDAPLKRELVTAVVHGASGLDGLDMSQTNFALSGDAPQRLIKLIKSNPGEISILALGPLSNIARALQQDPTIAHDIKELVIMGGAIAVPGNQNRVAEFNMYVDPEAADIVFRADIKKTLVPLDACNHVLLDHSVFDDLKGTPLYEVITELMKHFIAGLEIDEGVKGALVYDALAAYYLINPDAFTMQPFNIVIETTGEHTAGMTVAERRTHKNVSHNTLVAMHADREQFTHDLIRSLAQAPYG